MQILKTFSKILPGLMLAFGISFPAYSEQGPFEEPNDRPGSAFEESDDHSSGRGLDDQGIDDRGGNHEPENPMETYEPEGLDHSGFEQLLLDGSKYAGTPRNRFPGGTT